MTNLELAQQQGNQAAPNLLAAATAGELGGGSSMFPSLSTAGAVMARVTFDLDSDQADEAAANTIYNNCKLVTDNHLDLFMLDEAYLADGAELSTSVSVYFAFSARTLARIKNYAAFDPEFPAEIFDGIEPDELCTFEDESADNILDFVSYASEFGLDELPASASGLILLTAISSNKSPIPVQEDSLIYIQIATLRYGEGISVHDGLRSIQYYAESLLDTPVKLDKTYNFYPAFMPVPDPH